jgi:hypothetical protein
MKKCGLILLLAMLSFGAQGQQLCPEIDKAYKWENAGDYERDKEKVMEVLRWLCKTPLGDQVQQRSVANAYVMEWIAGTPSHRIELNTEAFVFLESHPELLFPFIHGAALFALKKEGEVNPVKLHVEALENVARLAEQSEELSKDSELKKLIRAYRRQVLEKYYEDALQPN